MPNALTRTGNLREALVDSALHLLAEGGVEKISLRAVAKRAGVSHAAPYHHFDDRRALLAAVAVRGFEGLRACLGSTLDARESASPGEIYAALVRSYVLYALDHSAAFRMMFRPELTGSHRATPALLEAAESVLLVIAEAIKRASGGALTSRPQALYAWSAIHGAATLILDGPIGDVEAQHVTEAVAVELARRASADVEVQASSEITEAFAHDEL